MEAPGRTWLEKNVGGWNWEKVAPVTMQVVGNEMQLAVPRRALKQSRSKTSFNFKWADHLQHAGDPMDFYLAGSVAPEGRFNYRYQTQPGGGW